MKFNLINDCCWLTVALATQSAVMGDVPPQGDKTIVVADKVPAKAYAFDLNQVRLLDGPFKPARELDRENLLKASANWPDKLARVEAFGVTWRPKIAS